MVSTACNLLKQNSAMSADLAARAGRICGVLVFAFYSPIGYNTYGRPLKPLSQGLFPEQRSDHE